jgi:hypothetical protein
MRFADNDHAGADQTANQGRGAAGAALCLHLRTTGCDPTLQLNQVFERHWNSMKRPYCVPGLYCLFGRLGRQPRVARIDFYKRMKLWLTRLNALEKTVDEINRRKAPGNNHLGENIGWQQARIGIKRHRSESPLFFANRRRSIPIVPDLLAAM